MSLTWVSPDRPGTVVRCTHLPSPVGNFGQSGLKQPREAGGGGKMGLRSPSPGIELARATARLPTAFPDFLVLAGGPGAGGHGCASLIHHRPASEGDIRIVARAASQVPPKALTPLPGGRAPGPAPRLGLSRSRQRKTQKQKKGPHRRFITRLRIVVLCVPLAAWTIGCRSWITTFCLSIRNCSIHHSSGPGHTFCWPVLPFNFAMASSC